MAAAHPVHAGRPREVSTWQYLADFVPWFCVRLHFPHFFSTCCVQVQRGVQVPAERAAGAVSAPALLGAADAEEAPQVHQDGRGQVAPAQPHGLPDRQPAVLPAGTVQASEALFLFKLQKRNRLDANTILLQLP